MKHLKQNHEETVQQWKNKVEKLKQTTWEHICPESIVRRKNVLINQQVKDAQLASKSSSFLGLTPEEFKQVLYRVHQEF